MNQECCRVSYFGCGPSRLLEGSPLRSGECVTSHGHPFCLLQSLWCLKPEENPPKKNLRRRETNYAPPAEAAAEAGDAADGTDVAAPDEHASAAAGESLSCDAIGAEAPSACDDMI